MRVNNLCGSGQYSGFYMNDASVAGGHLHDRARSRPRCRTAACASTARRKTAATPSPARFFAYGAGAGCRRTIGPTRSSRSSSSAWHRLSPTRSTRRSAARSCATSSGSISPTSTRTTRSSSPAPRSPTAARRSAQSQGNYSAVTRLTWQATLARQGALLSRPAVQRRGLQRVQHAADHHAGGLDQRVRPRMGPASQVVADDLEQAAARGRPLLLQPALRAVLHVERRADATCRAWSRPRAG